MRRRPVLGAVVAAMLATAAPAHAADWIIHDTPRSGPGAQAPGRQDKAVGLVVQSDAGGNVGATPIDQRLGASGFVFLCANCPPDCPYQHYHGRLFGQADPHPDNCGWGPVRLYGESDGLLQDAATAITDEWLAVRQPTPDAALVGLRGAGRALGRLRAHMGARSDLDGEDRARILGAMSRARKNDRGAAKELRRAQRSTDPAAEGRHHRRARRFLRKALADKRSMWHRIEDALLP